ncbi:MAG TPA: VWA domain-containing protein [Polyangiales bacterium]|nr:VWA domain-containing protein [Polyangiales bacterium]
MTQSKQANQAAHRWRLALGKYAQDSLGVTLDRTGQRVDRALDYLYGREYAGRGVRPEPPERGPGSLDASQLTLPEWLGEVRELFPRDVAELVEKHALERYGMSELLTDPETLERLEPSIDLLRALLSFRGQFTGAVLDAARRVIRRVVEQIRREIEPDVRRTLSGRINRLRHSPLALKQNFDPLGTLRSNLKHFDRQRKQLVLSRVRFFERNVRRLPWSIILCVDQSASMADSVIHSAVMASILAGLPSVDVKLVVFDTSIVDLSQYVSDPVEVLMNVQLSGGTDIGRALTYCEQLVHTPQRTALILISDFEEGASPAQLLTVCRRLVSARIKLLGLAALDSRAEPIFDRAMAARLAAAGMEIAALTPDKLAQWLVRVIS